MWTVETDVRTFVMGLWDDARGQGRRSVRGDASGLLLLVEQIRLAVTARGQATFPARTWVMLNPTCGLSS